MTSDDEVPPLVGFLGAGQMGRPMVERIIGGGFAVSAFVRRGGLGAELAAAGVRIVDSPRTVGERADILIVCFFDDRQIREVLLDGGVLAAMRPGTVLVSHVTGSPALLGELQAAAPGVSILDAPVSGTADQIRHGQLTVLVGGCADVLERVRPILRTYCNTILQVGGLGDGQRFKLINNLVFTVNLRTALLAAELALSMGISEVELARVLGECSGGSFALNTLRHTSSRALSAGVRPFLRKDVDTIRCVAADERLALGPLGDLANWVFE